MYLSGLSSQYDPFFVQVMEVETDETGLRLQVMVRPALLEDVYEKLEIDAVFAFSDTDAANGQGVSLLSKPAPKPVSKIQPKGDITLKIAQGVSVKFSMSLNKPKGHAEVKIDGPSTEVDFKFTMKYESSLELSLVTSVSLTQTEEIKVPLNAKYPIPFLDLAAPELLPFSKEDCSATS